MKWLAFLGVPAAVIAAVVLLWDWNWFIPLVEARSSATLGRPVAIERLDVDLGRITTVTLDGVRVGNPQDFPADQPPLAQVQRLSVSVDAMAYIEHRTLKVPRIDLEHPDISAVGLADGRNNYRLELAGGGSAPEIGTVTIEGGRLHLADPKLKSDFTLDVATREGGQGLPVRKAPRGAREQAQAAREAAEAQPAQLVVSGKGTYAGQPVTAGLIGGALLALRDSRHPYPVDLRLEHGPTRVSLIGTVDDPLNLQGLNLKLELSGPDMSLLYPLTGVPVPKTPAYRITGRLDYRDHRFRFDDFAGVVGNSDLGGTIAVDPGKERPNVTAKLHSRRVDLADLGGFVGTEPGRLEGRNVTPEQRRALARAEASPKLLPTKPINVPMVKAADVHLEYRGDRIEGRDVPFDRIVTTMDIVDGQITLHPITLTIGDGEMSGDVTLSPRRERDFRGAADLRFRRVDLSRVLSTAGVQGAGAVNGRARIDAVGNSVATLIGNGSGGASLYILGGDLSALIVDLSGLEFGNALLSALGVPKRTPLKCFIADFALERGVLKTRALLADTGDDLISGSGNIDLKNEALALTIKTAPKHFTIGSLPAPIEISGTLKKPSVAPAAAPLAVRGGLAVALGLLAGPLALLPTIQFGTGETHECAGLVSQVRGKASPGR